MPIIVSLSGVFAVPIFRSCRRFGLAASLALLTSGMLPAEVEAATATRAGTGAAAVSAARQTTVGTRRAPAHAPPRQHDPARVVVACPPRPSGPCPRHAAGARISRSVDAAVPHRRRRIDGPEHPRRSRHHLQPGHPAGAVGGERAELALHRQHHQGDDRGRVPRARARPHDARQDRAQRRARRVDDLSARQRRPHAERPAEPAAHRLGQRRGPRAGARLAVRHRGLHREDEREGAGARPRAHALRRSVRPVRAERLVGLRHGAPDLRSRPATSASPASCARAASRSSRAAAR